MATMRAGVTLWQAGQIEAGHSMLCKANGILMITHGPSHSITKDLEVFTAPYRRLNITTIYQGFYIVLKYTHLHKQSMK